MSLVAKTFILTFFVSAIMVVVRLSRTNAVVAILFIMFFWLLNTKAERLLSLIFREKELLGFVIFVNCDSIS